MDIKTVFEDNYLLVLDKPPGLVVDPSDTHQDITLAQICSEKFGITIERGGVIHRLDKDTSGLIIVAKTEEVLLKMQEKFKNREVKKQYMALVHGSVNEPGTVEGSIGRNPQNREKFIVLEEGKEAKTDYRPEGHYKLAQASVDTLYEGFNKIQFRKMEKADYNNFTLLRCFPFTGRTHQIRVHLKHIGFPIVGDEKYCGRKTARLDHRWCPRQFLHAANLQFIHPVEGIEMNLESPLPDDLQKVLSVLQSLV